MDLAKLATTRRTAKAFDPNGKIPEAVFDQLRVLLRHSPSSVNSQPWHFVVAASAAGKARLAAAAVGPYAYNAPKIQNASHVVAFCVRTDMDESHLAAILAQEQKDGRFPLAEDLEKQVYLALGTLLLGAAALGLDACPMEGFDAQVLDAELGLAARGLRAVVLVALGVSGSGDWNAALPKSRLPAESLFTDL